RFLACLSKRGEGPGFWELPRRGAAGAQEGNIVRAQKTAGARLHTTNTRARKSRVVSGSRTRHDRPRGESAYQRALCQGRYHRPEALNFLEHRMTQSAAASNDDAWNGRVEDDALLRGQRRFGDDVKPDGTLAAYFVRSPHAFAKIVRINVAAAKSAPGVVAVLTATDLSDAHYHSI